jgi:hypothetical protein
MATNLGPDVVASEYEGSQRKGDAIDPFLAELDDVERAKVVVVYEDGLRIPLPKLDAHTGDGAVKVVPGGKVIF